MKNMKNMKKYVFKSIAIAMIAALAINMVGCNISKNTNDTSSETLVSEIVSDEVQNDEAQNDEAQDYEAEFVDVVEEEEPADDESDANNNAASNSTTTTVKKTTTTTKKKSIFDIFTPDTTTTTKKATTTAKKTTTTAKKATTTTKNSTTTTKKATTTTTKKTTTTTQSAVKTSYSISLSGGGITIASDLTSSALYKKWGNSGIVDQGSLFGANYVLVKDTYGGFGLKCENSSLNDKITVKSSNNSIISIASATSNGTKVSVRIKAVGTGTATITASIPNNSKTFSFTVKVVTESDVISKYESKVMSLINGYRSGAGVAKLTTASNLKSPARTRAQECAQSFSHTRPNGTSFATSFQSAYPANAWSVNENIAKGQSLPGNAARAWYNSSGHRTTMLSTWYTKGNVGLYIAADGTFYWALEVVGPLNTGTSTATENSTENNVENNAENNVEA